MLMRYFQDAMFGFDLHQGELQLLDIGFTSLAQAMGILDMGLLQETCERILQVLLKFELASRQRVAPEYVGLHPCSRGGTGLVANQFFSLGIRSSEWLELARRCEGICSRGSSERYLEAAIK